MVKEQSLQMHIASLGIPRNEPVGEAIYTLADKIEVLEKIIEELQARLDDIDNRTGGLAQYNFKNS